MTIEIDWNDFRLFRKLANSGSVRGAAAQLGTSHSTLSRRLDILEKRLGVQLFERGPRGFKLTEAGSVLLVSAEAASRELDTGQRKIAGMDQRMEGPIRVTMPDILAYYILMPAIGAFQDQYPDVEIELDVSYTAHDLSRRESDIAVRMMHIGTSPPDHLVGRKVAQSFATGYASPDYLERHRPAAEDTTACWLGWEATEGHDWVADTAFPNLPVRGLYNHAELQHHAAVAGLGMAFMPCALGDTDNRLTRVPMMKPVPARDIWVLAHADLRHAKRMKLFRDSMSNALLAASDTLVGN